MAVRTYKPTTPARRRTSVVDFRAFLTGESPLKSLRVGRKLRAGRSRSSGRITVRHRGGGAKRLYRLVDLKQDHFNVPALVKSIEYDPNRGAFIARVDFFDGRRSYILVPQGLKVGEKIIYNPSTKVKPGNRMQLRNIPPGVPIHNLELIPGQGGKIVRGAGTAALISSFDKGFALVKLPSGEIRMIPERAYASIGVLSNPDHNRVRIGKAGRMRHRGIRPTVRGKAMNPVDHPHGGGEGGSPIGLKYPKTPQGRPAKGVKTRRRKFSDKLIIRRRR